MLLLPIVGRDGVVQGAYVNVSAVALISLLIREAIKKAVKVSIQKLQKIVV